MAWIMGLGALAGGLASNASSSSAARNSRYRPWNTGVAGLGSANFSGNTLNMQGDERFQQMNDYLGRLQYGSLQDYQQGQQNALGQDFLRGSYDTANSQGQGNLEGLFGAANSWGGYNSPDMMQGLNSGMLSNFDPNQAASQYTNLLRQQAQPQEQNAASSALTNLYGTGRLGTTGGMTAYQGLMDSQNQADIGRQVAGQQYGLQQQLMAQQGYDQSRMNQQGMMLNNFGAGQQGLMNSFGINQGMFGRNMDLYTASDTASQDRFNRALQLFGGENALNQQNLGNFSGLLGAQQSQNQQLLDMGRLGSSVGQAQNTTNANAAMMRNQGNQDMIAGFLGAMGGWARNRNQTGTGP